MGHPFGGAPKLLEIIMNKPELSRSELIEQLSAKMPEHNVTVLEIFECELDPDFIQIAFPHEIELQCFFAAVFGDEVDEQESLYRKVFLDLEWQYLVNPILMDFEDAPPEDSFQFTIDLRMSYLDGLEVLSRL